MDGKGNQGQGARPSRGGGRPNLDGLLGVDPCHRTTLLQWLQQQQSQDLQEPPAMSANPFATQAHQGFGNQGQAWGPRPYSTGLAGNGQLPNFPPAMPYGQQPYGYRNYIGHPVPFVGVPRSFGYFYQPPPPQWMGYGVGVPNAPGQGQRQGQQGQQQVQQPQGPGAGAGWHQQQVAHPQGNLWQQDPVPLDTATLCRASTQPPPEEQPAGEPAGQVLDYQPSSDDQDPSTSTNAVPMSVEERLERGLITDAAGLDPQETHELCAWARAKGYKWEGIRRRFKFTVKASTLRGRFRVAKEKRPPRVPKFTERDVELLLEAVEHLAGGHPEDVEKDKTKRLWARSKDYIRRHGGTTTAGASTLKGKYKALVKNTPQIRKDLKPSKSKWDHKAYDQYEVPGQKGASFDDDDAEDQEPAGGCETHDGGPRSQDPSLLQWNHGEYEKYDVEYEEGADFGETDGDMQEDGDDNNEDPAS